MRKGHNIRERREICFLTNRSAANNQPTHQPVTKRGAQTNVAVVRKKKTQESERSNSREVLFYNEESNIVRAWAYGPFDQLPIEAMKTTHEYIHPSSLLFIVQDFFKFLFVRLLPPPPKKSLLVSK